MSASVYLETIGCQMNVADSERADVRLRAAGYELSLSPEAADVIIFVVNVREGAVPLDREVADRLRRSRRG